MVLQPVGTGPSAARCCGRVSAWLGDREGPGAALRPGEVGDHAARLVLQVGKCGSPLLTCGHATLASFAPDPGSPRQFSLVGVCDPISRLPSSPRAAPGIDMRPHYLLRRARCLSGRMRYVMRATAASTEGVNLIFPTQHRCRLFGTMWSPRRRERERWPSTLMGTAWLPASAMSWPPETPVHCFLVTRSASTDSAKRTPKPWRQLHGRLAEIAVYNRVLTPGRTRRARRARWEIVFPAAAARRLADGYWRLMRTSLGTSSLGLVCRLYSAWASTYTAVSTPIQGIALQWR